MKLPLNIDFFRYYGFMSIRINLWLQFLISVLLHTDSLHTDHMPKLAMIANISSALFLLGLSGNRSSMTQPAMSAHYSYFSCAT